MMTWQRWKKGFDAWEDAAAGHTERWLRSPALLSPAGSVFTALMKARVVTDRATAACWSALGIPTRHDQERTLHALHQIQSRLSDLEEALADAQASKR